MADLGKKQWKKLESKGSTPLPISWHTTNLINDKVYLIGGMFSDRSINTKIYLLDLTTFIWTVVKEDMGQMYGHTALTYGNSIIVLGGMRLRTTLEVSEDEKRKLSGSLEGSARASTLSEGDLAEKQQLRYTEIDCRQISVLSTSIC